MNPCQFVTSDATKATSPTSHNVHTVPQAVHTAVLNPKAIKMGELYGEYNLLTNEWHDGLASCLIRAAVAEEGEDRHWVVFDGPVDAVWVENMNTGGQGVGVCVW